MQRISMIVIVTLLGILAHTQCTHLGLRGSKMSIPVEYPIFDSLAISVELNDSVFSLRDCSQYLQRTAEFYRSGEDTASTPYPPVPKLLVALRNLSSQSMLVPQRDITVRGGTTGGPCEVAVYLGTEASSGARLSFIPQEFICTLVSYRDPAEIEDYYHLLTGGDSLLLEGDEINVLHATGVERIWPGTYWVAVRVMSTAYVDTIPPIWSGYAWSDTVTFRVEE